MFFILSKILYFFILPFTWVLAAFLISIFTNNPRLKRRTWAIGIFLLIIFSNPLLSHKSLSLLESKPTIEVSPHKVGIVLSGIVEGGVHIQGQTQLNESAERLTEAVRLYNAGLIEKILISGGAADINYPDRNEGEELNNLALSLGIPAEDLLSEQQSRNTYENALFVRERFGESISPALLITSAYHMPRAQRCFEKQGLIVTPFSVDFRTPDDFKWSYLLPSVSAFSNWHILAKELVGLSVYKLKGYI